MTSGQMLGPMPGTIAYAVSKAALDAFTITFAREVGKYGITVNAVDPGPTDTGWMTQEVQKDLLPRYSLGRLGQPEDAARLVAFLARAEANWITGLTIPSRGGFYKDVRRTNFNRSRSAGTSLQRLDTSFLALTGCLFFLSLVLHRDSLLAFSIS
jgi:NAD(P)-dependent dehydrogenase (short-subunit alcohol dehydrogenase family)